MPSLDSATLSLAYLGDEVDGSKDICEDFLPRQDQSFGRSNHPGGVL